MLQITPFGLNRKSIIGNLSYLVIYISKPKPNDVTVVQSNIIILINIIYF